MHAMTMRDRAALWLLSAICLCLAVGVDTLYFPAGPVFPDEGRFLASAAHLAATGEFRVGADVAWEMPAVAGLLAMAIGLFGSPEAAVLPMRLAQALLLAGQVWLIHGVAFRLFADRRAGLAAAAITAVYPFFLFYQGLLLSEMLFTTLLVAGMAALLRWRAGGGGEDRWLILAMLVFAAASWTKASLTLLPPLLAAVALVGTGVAPRAWGRAVAVAGVVFMLALAPWWVRNAILLDTFVPFTTSAGQNLYLGNNAGNHGGGADWSADVDPQAAARIFAIPDEVARNRAFVAEALAFVRAEPAMALELTGRKLLRFWNIVPNAESVRSPLLMTVSALSFGPVLVLSLFGVVLGRRRLGALLPVLLLIAYVTALHTVTIASLRYRLPLEPFLIALAAGPLAVLSRRVVPQDPLSTVRNAFHSLFADRRGAG